MIARRRFLVTAAATGLAAPFIIRSVARAATPRVRRDVMDMADNDPFFKKYGDAVAAMHKLPSADRRNWIRQAKTHADFCRHGEISFLHWHRHYINFFEAICSEMIGDPDFALPYWNWSKKSGVMPAPFYDIQELNVVHWNDPGVYNGQNWGPVNSVPKRGLTKGKGLLNDPVRGGSFTLAKINSIKNLPDADTFEAGLEGSPHNDGHVVSGALANGQTGHIGDGLSPLDPIFWLHHCMVDRVWAEWQRTHTTPDPGDTYATDFVDRKGAAASVTSGGAMTVAGLGYTYDVLQPPVGPFVALNQGGNLLKGIAPELEKVVGSPPVLKTLGSASYSGTSKPLIQTAIKVSTTNLAETLAGDRAFKTITLGQETIGVESRRTIAKLSDVQLKSGHGDLVVNVFVNCPYLSPSTGYSDPHYAGSFSFFGHGGHNGKGKNFVIDITTPVQALASAGAIKNEDLTIQLMPVPAYINGKTEASFQVGKVDIIAF
ncbi:tyrosinase family protein [Bradyrhizobium sp.]